MTAHESEWECDYLLQVIVLAGDVVFCLLLEMETFQFAKP